MKKIAGYLINTAGRQLFVKVVLPMDKMVNAFSFKDEYYPFEEINVELDKEQNL